MRAFVVAALLLVCTGARAQDDAMPVGPVQASLLDGELGVARRVHPRSELALAGAGLVLADFDAFYGNVRAAAVLSGSYAADERTELFAAFEAFHYETVISSIDASHAGIGHLSLGATRVLASDEELTFGASTRLVLPTALGLYDNAWPIGMDLSALLAWQPRDRLQIHGRLGGLGTVAITGGPVSPRGAILATAGVAYRPWGWVSIALDLDTSFGRTDALDHLALAPALRFAIGRRVGLELSATFPMLGRERAFVAVLLRASVRLDSPLCLRAQGLGRARVAC